MLDRFREVICLYREGLCQGGIYSRAHLDMKKEAFVKRMEKEYLKMVQEKQ